MKKIRDWIKQLTVTELILTGTVIILLILIIYRWEWIYDEVSSTITDRFDPLR
ncbi:MAG: hypothetical protein PHD06_05410 [Bacteroidales bacterium]|jgi:hypothetical protein|nr:hypothetical protein [Bacteroidales bacterium]MDD4384599.1 hypothetical protein [Bacteroidales bacterium]MDY0196881.1 hypothetical protein [Tenuifilaceae bacterium]